MKDGELANCVSVHFSSHMRARVHELTRELKVPVMEVVRRAVESQLPVREGGRRQGVSEETGTKRLKPPGGF
jgi:hypothetical protein